MELGNRSLTRTKVKGKVFPFAAAYSQCDRVPGGLNCHGFPHPRQGALSDLGDIIRHFFRQQEIHQVLRETDGTMR
jgi:hypothetical protein